MLAVLLAGCGATSSASPVVSPAATSGGAASGAPCPSVSPPDDGLEGWGPPATTPTVIPILIASPGQLVCGPNRVLFTFVNEANEPIAAPDRAASLAIYELGRDPATPIATVDGDFVWAIEDVRGIYVANLTFPAAGRYGAEFETSVSGGAVEQIRLTFDVQPSSSLVKVGDRAPASKTPTLSDVGGDIARVSTDTDPEPAFYETSVDEALAEHEPFLLAFATPKFCASSQCGPTLDRIKPFLERYPSVTFINVEPYVLEVVDGSLEPVLGANGQLQPAEPTKEWNLFNEPMVFVVDREGIVQGAFELIFGDDELTAALDRVK